MRIEKILHFYFCAWLRYERKFACKLANWNRLLCNSCFRLIVKLIKGKKTFSTNSCSPTFLYFHRPPAWLEFDKIQGNPWFPTFINAFIQFMHELFWPEYERWEDYRANSCFSTNQYLSRVTTEEWEIRWFYLQTFLILVWPHDEFRFKTLVNSQIYLCLYLLWQQLYALTLKFQEQLASAYSAFYFCLYTYFLQKVLI